MYELDPCLNSGNLAVNAGLFEQCLCEFLVQPIVFEVKDANVPSDVADILSRDLFAAGPVLVYAKAGSACRISVRSPAGSTLELGPKVRELAAACGGSGGGHNLRAGATIPCESLGAFAKGWQEALA